MEKALSLLIADRNPHVRNYLQREFTEARYRVRTAENADTILADVYGTDGSDLLIIDPDLPDTHGETLLATLLDRLPKLSIIIHTLRSEEFPPMGQGRVFVVEKQGSSIERLKQIISELEGRIAGHHAASRR
ncbi:MAG: response regulator [Desulfobacterales bacterium]|nr:response regulator [Desulfobacterales bacterium]